MPEGFKKLCAAIYGSGTPDDCCVEIPSCALTYQKKGGSASLCGFSEYTTPSTPPKKYRKQSIAGGAVGCEYIYTNSCAAYVKGYGYSGYLGWTGSKEYSQASCAITNTQSVSGSQSNPASDCGSDGTTVSGTITASDPFEGNLVSALNPSIPPSSGGPTTTVSPTNKTWTYPGICYSTIKNSGYVEMGLSIEDTQDDAISRENAGIGSWTPCTSDCYNYTETRTGFSFGYQTIQYKITAEPTTLGATYEATLNVQRRAHGTSDAWEDWIEVFHEFVGVGALPAGSDPYVSDWLQLPSLYGYDVRISGCTIAVVAPP
jgi:hypothetical protein